MIQEVSRRSESYKSPYCLMSHFNGFSGASRDSIDQWSVCEGVETPYVCKFATNDMERVINRNITPMD